MMTCSGEARDVAKRVANKKEIRIFMENLKNSNVSKNSNN